MNATLLALKSRLRDRVRAGKYFAGPVRDLLRRMPWHRCSFLGWRSARPRELRWKTQEYLDFAPEARDDRFHLVYPAESAERALPASAGDDVPEVFARHREVRIAEAGVFALHGARFWGGASGCVIGADNRLLADLSPDIWGPERHRALTVPWLPKVRALPGVTAVLAAHGEDNYWHWMTESLPRFHLLAAAGFPPARVDRYLTTASGTRFQSETLAALGIPREKLVRVDARSHCELESALVPTHRPASWDVPQWVARLLRELPLGAAPVPESGERLYVVRGAAGHRRLGCEEELLPRLRERGFATIRCGEHSVAEQRARFAAARVIVAPHGAALTNLVFCRPGAAVLDLMSAAWPGLFFWGMSAACGLRYACLLDGAAATASPPDRRRGIDLGAEEICARLDEVIASLSAGAPPMPSAPSP